jgi:hypothetical protein
MVPVPMPHRLLVLHNVPSEATLLILPVEFPFLSMQEIVNHLMHVMVLSLSLMKMAMRKVDLDVQPLMVLPHRR